MRTKSSARFEPYYKLQWLDDLALAWKDLQKAFPTVAAAEAAMTAGKVWRVMEVTPQGRRPLQ